MSREAFLRRFHAAQPGVTSAAFARGDSYARLAARVPADARVLDLGCGDGHLMTLLPHARAIGVDFSAEELALARTRGHVVQARAQALPFAAAAFDLVVSHLALTLMDDLDAIAAELARVLVAGGELAAIVGGGPTADASPATDAFASWLELLSPHVRAPRLGDPRARTPQGWRAVLAPHAFTDVTFTRHVIDLSGDFDAVWTTLSTIYEADAVPLAPLRAQLAARFPGPRVPCAMAVYLATATKTRR